MSARSAHPRRELLEEGLCGDQSRVGSNPGTAGCAAAWPRKARADGVSLHRGVSGPPCPFISINRPYRRARSSSRQGSRCSYACFLPARGFCATQRRKGLRPTLLLGPHSQRALGKTRRLDLGHSFALGSSYCVYDTRLLSVPLPSVPEEKRTEKTSIVRIRN